MHKIEIPQRGITREFPSEIDEMNQHQFIFFIGLILQYLNGSLSLETFKILLINKLLDIRLDTRYLAMASEEKENIFAEIFRISDLCESFFEEIEQDGKKVKTFKLSFTKQFIPKICGRYHGPKDALEDITFCEYRMAHSFYASYLESHSEDDLNHLIAVLYRPVKPLLFIRRLLPSFNGQTRMPLTSRTNPAILESRAKKMANLPMAVRYAIFLYFSGCEQFLAKGKVNIDGKEIDFSIIYEKPDDSVDSPDIGLIGILYSLAETKVFGSIAETDDQNLYDIMIRLYQVVSQSKAMEAKYKSNGIG